MSYIQLELGGKLRGLKFNNAAVDTYWQKLNLNESGASSIYATIYAGLIGNDIAKGVQDSGYNYEQVSEWVDELYNNDEQSLVKATEIFAETTGYKKRLEKLQEHIRLLSNDKKKVEENTV